MRLTRRLSFLAVLVLLAGLPPLGPAAAADDPTAFMTTLGNRVLALINDKKQAETERKEQFQKLAEDAFDIPKIAQWVLGRYWRSATDAEKQSFGKAFEGYMLQVYWSRFGSYNGEGFTVTGAHDEGNGTILVTTEILRPDSGQPPVKISWSLVKQGDTYKIRDASLEGISQAQTYRDEFASIIERNGGQISALITQLTERAKG